MAHICVSEIIIIGSDNGFSPGRRQAIIWTSAGILLIGSFGIHLSEILIEINLLMIALTQVLSDNFKPSLKAALTQRHHRDHMVSNLTRTVLQEMPKISIIYLEISHVTLAVLGVDYFRQIRSNSGFQHCQGISGMLLNVSNFQFLRFHREEFQLRFRCGGRLWDTSTH